jgi:hypothetical protein
VKTPPKKAVERVVLGKAQAEKIDVLAEAVNSRFSGMLRATRSDLVNFLIDEHSENLSDVEAASLKKRLYSEVRFTSWALAQLRQAKQNGISLTLDDLRAQADMTTQTPQRQRKSKNKSDLKSAQDTSLKADVLQIDDAEIAMKLAVENENTAVNSLESLADE